ncbi:hypothetical protein PAMP_024974 [Pampus punctatissimus]
MDLRFRRTSPLTRGALHLLLLARLVLPSHTEITVNVHRSFGITDQNGDVGGDSQTYPAAAYLQSFENSVMMHGSRMMPLGLRGMPRFIKSPDDQTGISGGVASFVCQAVGEPKPRITWMKKGKKVSSQRFEVIEFDDGSGSVLRIQPLRTHRDEAIYECTATNSVGEINTSAKLTVLEDIVSSKHSLRL